MSSVFLDHNTYEGEYDDPNGQVVPENPDIPCLYRKQGTLIALWRWDVVLQSWQPVITS